MTIDEIREKKVEAEIMLRNMIRNVLNKFEQETGVCPDQVSVSLAFSNTVGDQLGKLVFVDVDLPIRL